MKWLIRKLAPGAIVTVVALVLAGVFSHAADSRPVPIPSSPAPAIYAESPNAGGRYVDGDARPRAIARDRCSQCGAQIGADGRAVQFRDRDDVDDRRFRQERAPQVVYVVHVNAYDAQDLRAWPQSIFPASTRFAMPIRNNCAHVQDVCARW